MFPFFCGDMLNAFDLNAIRYMQAVADEIVLQNIDPQKVVAVS